MKPGRAPRIDVIVALAFGLSAGLSCAERQVEGSNDELIELCVPVGGMYRCEDPEPENCQAQSNGAPGDDAEWYWMPGYPDSTEGTPKACVCTTLEDATPARSPARLEANEMAYEICLDVAEAWGYPPPFNNCEAHYEAESWVYLRYKPGDDPPPCGGEELTAGCGVE